MCFACFYPQASWRDIAKHPIHEMSDDHCFGLAAQLAFYLLLALCPALLFVSSRSSGTFLSNTHSQTIAGSRHGRPAGACGAASTAAAADRAWQ
jgi:uncharacterized BrkB/YihY/UPF0761 family membrane protein